MKFFGYWSFIILLGCEALFFKNSNLERRIFLFNLIPAKKSHYEYVQTVRHIKPRFRLKVKSPLPNTPSINYGGLREGDDFTIQKVLDLEESFLEKIKGIPGKDLAGFQTQIASINCPEFRKILSDSNLKSNKSDEKSVPVLSLEECLKEKKTAYFQMNVNGYGEISRQIGRMILQDLKVLSNRIQAGQGDFSYPFSACFVDEFGSFATGDFADFLKMARSSRIGISLFCQGLSDLSRISPDFKNQIIGNTATKILFRQDVGRDAEEWAEMAGTFTSRKQTYQVSGTETEEERTGMGSVREVKEMKIEFDVFKRLSPGQAVLIDKARHREDLFQVWRPVL